MPRSDPRRAPGTLLFRHVQNSRARRSRTNEEGNQQMKPSRVAHLFFFAGIVSIVAGAWLLSVKISQIEALIYHPAGLIVCELFGGWLAFLIAAEMPK